jgi:hypothetical protein
MAVMYSVSPDDVSLYNLHSFDELVGFGVSEDEDLRVFETGWSGTQVTGWATEPLFLTNDVSLLGKWAERYGDLANQEARTAIRRAK